MVSHAAMARRGGSEKQMFFAMNWQDTTCRGPPVTPQNNNGVLPPLARYAGMHTMAAFDIASKKCQRQQKKTFRGGPKYLIISSPRGSRQAWVTQMCSPQVRQQHLHFGFLEWLCHGGQHPPWVTERKIGTSQLQKSHRFP